MKKPSKKLSTPAAMKRAAEAAGFSVGKIQKVTPPKTVAVNKAAVRKTARAAERRKARLVTVPKKYKAALSRYGLGAAQPIIKKRGRYYTAAGVYQVKKNGLEVKHAAQVQNVVSWARADRKGWYIKVVNGVAQKKLIRWADLNRDQKSAWRVEKIRVVAAKTGLTKTRVREILSDIRRVEGGKLRRFKKTKKYARLTAAQKRRHTIAGRVNAIFGAMCDLLEIYGSPKTSPDVK